MENPLSHEDYSVAIICPLVIELSAVRSMLDEEHLRLPSKDGDPNLYILGTMSNHNVAIGFLPQGKQGVGAAAVVATNMGRTFPSARLRLLVGIGGGVPSKKNDIRLGDVVIGMPDGIHSGVVEYDLGKETTDGFKRKGFLRGPPDRWANAVVLMQADHLIKPNRIAEFVSVMLAKSSRLQQYARPEPDRDILFAPDNLHKGDEPSCDDCDKSNILPARDLAESRIFYGTIASGNKVVKDARVRDMISKAEGGILCLEMEAAGLSNSFPSIVIRGICDYADSHKNDDWHHYAAAAAAACAKELLTYMEPSASVVRHPSRLSYIGGLLQSLLLSANSIRHGSSQASDDLLWFTNTLLYHAWLSPPRGQPIICSRFIWYAGDTDNQFSSSYFHCSRLIEADVLYLNCKDEGFHLGGPIPPAAVAFNFRSVGIQLWSLIIQALDDRCESDLLSGIALCCRAHPEVLEAINESGLVELPSLVKMLITALNLKPTRGAIIVIDHVDHLEENELLLLRNLIQNVLDAQRESDVAQTRALIIGKREPKVALTFKGTAEIDENTEYNECLQSLRFDNMGLRRTRIAPADVGTNHWLWAHPAYISWKNRNSSILWIVGKPGSGKSVLSRSIQENLLHDAEAYSQANPTSNNQTPIVCAWFYSEREGLTSHTSMLRAIIAQILDQERDLFTSITDNYRIVTPFKAQDGSIWSFLNSFRALASMIRAQGRTRPILCILDGLDESNTEAVDPSQSLSNLLWNLCNVLEMAHGFKLIVLSRHHPDIDHRLRDYDRIVMQDVNQADIAQVVRHGIDSLQKILNCNGKDGEEDYDEYVDVLAYYDLREESLQTRTENISQRTSERRPQLFDALNVETEDAFAEIEHHLISQADGVILWVKACFGALEQKAAQRFATLEDILTELHVLPVEIEDFYDYAVQKLAKRLKTPALKTLAYRAILWVRFASENRQLRLQDLLDALSIPDDTEVALRASQVPFRRFAAIRSLGAFRRHLQWLCAPFLEFIPAQMPSNETSAGTMSSDGDEYVQIIHQSAKEFLERSSDASFLKLPLNAGESVAEESRRYLRVALPAQKTKYDPIAVAFGSLLSRNVELILSYLEHRPLLSFILSIFPDLKNEVPTRYQCIFKNTVFPTEEELSRLQKIAELYFHIGCINGLSAGVENILSLQTLCLKDRGITADWYLFENSSIRAALRACLRFRLHDEIRYLAWYVGERGLDLLDFPQSNIQGKIANDLIRETLETGDMNIAVTVIGYEDEEERASLEEQIARFQQRGRTRQSHEQAYTDAERNRARDAIWTLIQFWGTPPALLLGEFGANVFGANVFGANVFSMVQSDHKTAEGNLIRGDVINQIYGSDIDYTRNHRRFRQSHRHLSNVVPILKGGRNLFNLRLPSISEGVEVLREHLKQQTGIPYIYDELEAYLEAQKSMLRGEIAARNTMTTMTTDEEFAMRMNDAAWKTASSAASDKIQ